MKKNYGIMLLILCIIQIGLGISFGMQKTNFHVDEIYSFGLANNTTGTTMSIPQGELIDRSVLDDYVTVDTNHRFDYSNVWKNQAADVHPPLYYVLIHTISSLFPGKFMLAGGIGLNIMFSLIATLLIYFITKELTNHNGLPILVCAVWSVSLGTITFIVFIRMYMILTVFMLAITLLHIKYLHKKLTFQFYLSVLFLSVLGVLTQYYFLIYLFFLCLLFGVNLLMNKNFKSAFLYLLSLGGSGIIAIGLFPAMLTQIFSGYRGKESFDNIANTSDLVDRYKTYYKIISKELFNEKMTILLILLLLLGIVFIIRNSKDICWRDAIFSGFNLLLFPSICYFVIVSKISVFVTDRYIMPIFPIILILVILSFTYLSSKLVTIKYMVTLEACIFILLSVVGLAQNSNINYLYKETSPAIQFAASNKEADVLVVYTGAWRLNAAYEELIQYDHLRIISTKKLAKFTETIDNYGNTIVYIIGDDPLDTLANLMNMNPRWSSYTLESTSQYTNIYLVN
ncbi:MAG: hypothetical protein ACERKZ_08810 [Lachnotalea sp.]